MCTWSHGVFQDHCTKHCGHVPASTGWKCRVLRWTVLGYIAPTVLRWTVPGYIAPTVLRWTVLGYIAPTVLRWTFLGYIAPTVLWWTFLGYIAPTVLWWTLLGYIAPTVWSSLTADLTASRSLLTCKAKLKTHFFRQAFCTCLLLPVSYTVCVCVCAALNVPLLLGLVHSQ